MDAFEFDNVKAEKAKALLMYNRLRTIAKLFRLVELFSALLLLSWISPRLPLVVKISGDYFRQLIGVILSPLFIFLTGNAIVIALLAKSGKTPASNNAETDLYEEFIKFGHNGPGNPPQVPEAEAILYDDKEIIICEEGISTDNITPMSKEVVAAIAGVRVSDFKTLERSKSENLTRRRSETEKCGKVVDPGSIVEELSNEEFQRTIEEFIAKQVKFHKEEIEDGYCTCHCCRASQMKGL